MSEIYLVIYTHTTNGHSFVTNAYASKKRAEHRANYDNQNDPQEQIGPACALGYHASVFTVKLDNFLPE